MEIKAPFTHLARLRIANVWLYDAGAHGRWLIDTGHWAERRGLLAELVRQEVGPGSLAGVLLTHRHSDHAGNAAFLSARYGLRVFALGPDAAILRGAVPRPRMGRGRGDPIAALLTVFENRAAASCPEVIDLQEGEQIAGLEVLAAPGHTEGSAVFWHAPSATLLTGDTLLNAIPPLTLRVGLCLPHPTFSTDLRQALRSICRLQDRGLPYEDLLPGHGPAVRGGARAQVDRLLEAEGVRARI